MLLLYTVLLYTLLPSFFPGNIFSTYGHIKDGQLEARREEKEEEEEKEGRQEKKKPLPARAVGSGHFASYRTNERVVTRYIVYSLSLYTSPSPRD